MSHFATCTAVKNRKEPKDVFYTPLPVAMKLIKMADIKEHEKVLDPSRGLGVFYNNFPNCAAKDWCEITENKDFFDYNEHVDVIIGNPPFSMWNKWLDHSIKLKPSRICYVIGVLNLSPQRIERMSAAGYKITKIEILNVRDWFSNTLLVVFDKHGEAVISHDPNVYKNT
jgi:type I restriction-modification system DNA methylase subunit